MCDQKIICYQARLLIQHYHQCIQMMKCFFFESHTSIRFLARLTQMKTKWLLQSQNPNYRIILTKKQHKIKSREDILVVVGQKYVCFLLHHEFVENSNQSLFQVFHVTSIEAQTCPLIDSHGVQCNPICFLECKILLYTYIKS